VSLQANATSMLTISGTGATVAGFIKSSAATSGIGYATGAGGTVTQLTDKTTGVTLNKACGQITTMNSALAASTTVSFTFTNSTITATDKIGVWLVSGAATAGTYQIWTETPSAGTVKIVIRNTSAGSLSEALVIGFMVFKGVTA